MPETTIEVDSGEFYRVYHDGTIRPSTVELLAAMLLTYFAPVFGLGLLFRLLVTYRVNIEPR